jgi:acetylornithine deacetylase
MLFRVTVLGRTAHAAQAQEGVNAIGKLLLLYQAMVDLDAERAARWTDPFFGPKGRAVHLNIGTFRAGDWPSTVAGQASMECRISFIPPQTMAEVRREVEERVAATAAADAWLRAHSPQVEWFGWQAGPWRQDPDHPFVQTLAAAVEAVAGVRPPLEAVTAGLDARLAGHFDMPAACLGARGEGMHSADEYVEVDSVIEATRTIAAAIVFWCGARD